MDTSGQTAVNNEEDYSGNEEVRSFASQDLDDKEDSD